MVRSELDNNDTFFWKLFNRRRVKEVCSIIFGMAVVDPMFLVSIVVIVILLFFTVRKDLDTIRIE